MKSKLKMIITLSMVAIVSVGLLGVPSLANIYDSSDEDNQTILILNDNVNENEIDVFVSENHIEVKEIVSKLSYKGRDVTFGFVVNDQKSFLDLWLDFNLQEISLLEEAMDANSDNLDVVKELENSLKAFQNGKVNIDQILCAGSLNVKSLKNSEDIISEYYIENITENKVDVKKQNEEKINATKASNWLPTSGNAYAWPSSGYPGTTYLEVVYKWNSSSAMSGFSSDSTLEAEIVLYNYDGGAISTAWNSNYAYTSNQPYAYRDTQVLDNSNEPNFTIGCAAASNCVAGTNYYWIAYGNQTSSGSCKAKVSFQRGYRLVPSIYSTWNIFPLETTIVVPFSQWTTGSGCSF